jgi:hypothetical protein
MNKRSQSKPAVFVMFGGFQSFLSTYSSRLFIPVIADIYTKLIGILSSEHKAEITPFITMMLSITFYIGR